MRRSILCYAVLGTLGLGFLSASPPAAQPPKPLSKDKAEKQTAPSKDPILQKNEEIRERLRKPVDFSGIDDPKVSLTEALALLSNRYDLLFQVNEAAFAHQEVPDVLNQPVATKPLTPLHNVPLQRVLNYILARLPVEVGATFLVHDGLIEITTRQAASPSNWTNPQIRQFIPTVSTTLKEERLDTALQDIANGSGINIVIDPQCSAEAAAPSVSAQFQQVPVDTAVYLLANMRGLRAIVVDTVLYVTSKENAEGFLKQRHKTSPAMIGPVGGFGVGGGVVGGFGARGGFGVGGGLVGGFGVGGGLGGANR